MSRPSRLLPLGWLQASENLRGTSEAASGDRSVMYLAFCCHLLAFGQQKYGKEKSVLWNSSNSSPSCQSSSWISSSSFSFSLVLSFDFPFRAFAVSYSFDTSRLCPSSSSSSLSPPSSSSLSPSCSSSLSPSCSFSSPISSPLPWASAAFSGLSC